MSPTREPDSTSTAWPGRSRTRVIVGVVATALVLVVGALLGRWQTRPPADDPGPADPVRRSSRPW